jgi:hypothetical protein
MAGSYSLQHACRSPLLAALACVAHEERPLTGDATRRDLYERVVDSVLHRKWKGTKEEAPGSLDVDDLKTVLLPVAWRLFASSPAVNQFPNKQVTKAIAEANRGGLVARGAAAIRDEWVRSGLLVQAGQKRREGKQLSFLHRTVMEYLAGEHLANEVMDEGWGKAKVRWGTRQHVPVSLLVEKKGWLPEWREALVLLGGGLEDAVQVDRFLGLLMGVADDLYGHRLGLAAVSLAEQPMGVRKKLHGRVDEITRRGYKLYWGHLIHRTVSVSWDFQPAWKSVGKLNGRIANGREVVALLVQAVLSDADADVRLMAASALGRLGEAGLRSDVLAALVQAVRRLNFPRDPRLQRPTHRIEVRQNFDQCRCQVAGQLVVTQFLQFHHDRQWQPVQLRDT